MKFQAELNELIHSLTNETPEGPRVSLYLEASPQSDQLEKNRIRLRNALDRMKARFDELDLSSGLGKDFEQRLIAASGRWQDGTGLRGGLAAFISRECLRTLALPFETENQVFVSDHYHLKPLYAALPYAHQFGVLTLSRERARFFCGDGLTLEPFAGNGVKTLQYEAVVGRETTEPQLQHHSGQGGGAAAMWHGQGAGKDDVDADLQQYFKALDDMLGRARREFDGLWILAGDSPLLAAFRNSTAHSQRLHTAQIEGNVDELSAEALHQQAWPLVEKDLRKRQRQSLDRATAGDPDRPVANGVPDVVRAALGGRVDTLFVAGDQERWGRIKTPEKAVELHEQFHSGDIDLLDCAATESLRHGGRVEVVPSSALPANQQAVANLRY